MSAGDYRKPGIRPADQPLAADFGLRPEVDRRKVEWFEWLKFEMFVRMGYATRTGEPSSARIPTNMTDEEALENVVDAFFDRWDGEVAK